MRRRCSTTDAAAQAGLRRVALTGLPMVSMAAASLLGEVNASWKQDSSRWLDGRYLSLPLILVRRG